MIITPLPVEGAFLLEAERAVDDRGCFARLWCESELAGHGLVSHISQMSLSCSTAAGTVRGLHYQAKPFEETKLVRCTRGALYDVIVDLRQNSRSYLVHAGLELTPGNCRSIYIPPGCAHGLQTLAPDTEVLYAMDVPFQPDAAKGVRWNDPAFAIGWPLPVTVISPRDRSYPDYITR